MWHEQRVKGELKGNFIITGTHILCHSENSNCQVWWRQWIFIFIVYSHQLPQNFISKWKKNERNFPFCSSKSEIHSSPTLHSPFAKSVGCCLLLLYIFRILRKKKKLYTNFKVLLLPKRKVSHFFLKKIIPVCHEEKIFEIILECTKQKHRSRMRW